MAVETIGDAHAMGWCVTVRCNYERGDGPDYRRNRECNYRRDLDMETLVWTRGRDFPLSRLESRLRCPRCGSRNVVVLYHPPRRTVAR
jgi:DNA-directed RNA polymerase subunit RPC12/RpoP